MYEQHGVTTGCLVSAQGTPNMTVAVAAGSVLNQNVAASVAAQNATITPADPTNPRYDLISVSNTGTVTVTAGTPAATPVQPDNTDVRIAFVYVAAGATSITSDTIQDVRDFALVHLSPYRVTGLWYGPIAGSVGTSNAWATGELYFVPFFCGSSLNVQAIGCNLTTAGTSGSKGRLGIYLDDGAGDLALLVDAGQVALDGATGGLSLNTTQTIPPGWCWLAMAFQTLGASIPTMRILDRMSVSPVGSYSLDNAAVGHVGAMKITGVTGTLPSTPTGFSYNLIGAPGVWVQAS